MPEYFIKKGTRAYTLYSKHDTRAKALDVTKGLRSRKDKAVIHKCGKQHCVYRKSLKQPAWW